MPKLAVVSSAIHLLSIELCPALQDLPQRLVLIRQCERFAELPGRGSARHGVYKVQNVVCVPISPEAGAVANLGLKPCPKHHPTANLTGRKTRAFHYFQL